MKNIFPVLVVTLSVTMLACADMAMSESAGSTNFTTLDQGLPNQDVGVALPDFGGNDTGLPRDAADFDQGPFPPPGLPRDAVFPAELLKDVPEYLVPAAVGAKAHLAISPTMAAWVNISPRGRELVTWELFGEAAPKTWTVPGLVNPRQLAVSQQWLVWVDVTHDPTGDLFALNLQTGTSSLVVGVPGAQNKPALNGSVLVWQDCRACSTTTERPTPSIYRRDLNALPVEEALVDDGLAHSLPVLGTLADESVAVAWLVGTSTIRVVGNEVDTSFPAQGSGVEGLALWQGTLAFRTQPAIINPDSMIPTDPWAIDVASGTQTLLATDQNLSAGLPSKVVVAGDGFAWLDQDPADPSDIRVVVVGADASPIGSFAAPVATEIVGGGGWIGLVAPLAVNADESDILVKAAP